MARHFLLGTQDLLQALDQTLDLLELVEDFFALETGQFLQAHVQDRLCLQVAEFEFLHQVRMRFDAVL